MDITFSCPHCGEVTLIDEAFVGQSGPCRTCDKIVTVTHIVPKSNRGVDSFPVTGTFLRWCNRTLGYVVLGILVLGILSLLLAPVLDDTRQSARRMSSGNNLKQIALAFHNYHDTYEEFPRPYWVSANGERTLSWRVAILPFMESSPFFDRYRVDEPWNSPFNRDLASYTPYAFHGTWNQEKSSRETAYLVVTGPGTLFDVGENYALRDCTDGSANTILVVEVRHSGVEWTEPRDLDIRTMIMQINGSDSNGISSPWKDGAQVAMADGSVKFLSNKTLESTLRAMLTRAGGETVSP